MKNHPRDYHGSPNVMFIPLRDRSGTLKDFATVDAEDYERLTGYRWRINSYGHVVRTHYVQGRLRPRRLDRTILGHEQNCRRHIRHANGNRVDFRKANLRLVLPPGHPFVEYHGVSWSQDHGKWRVYLPDPLGQLFIGFYFSLPEAVNARDEQRQAFGLPPLYDPPVPDYD